jgi:hypothetical protein
MARHCSGAVILGFSQSIAERVILKPNTADEKKLENVKMPIPWNHLEAGIFFSLRLPLMVFREEGISGGVFDDGVTDVFINKLPVSKIDKTWERQMIAAIQIWVARVREHYRLWGLNIHQ